MSRPEVYVLKRNIQDPVRDGYFEDMAKEMLRALDVSPGGRLVMMKPNVTGGSPRESGIVTHPAFVGGIADYFVDTKGIKCEDILVAEALDVRTLQEKERYWGRSGYSQMAKEKNLHLIDLCDYGNVRVRPEGTVLRNDIGISRWAKSEDVFYMNVPKFKTHNLSIITLCGKNQQGVMIPACDRHLCWDASKIAFQEQRIERKNQENHNRWQTTIAHLHWDLYLALQPDFNMIEGVVGRDGNAFYLGRNFTCGLVIAGYDMPSVDLVGGYLMGFDVSKLIYLKIGMERGIVPESLDDVEVLEIKGKKVVQCDDLNSLICNPRFEVYREIPEDLSKKDLFDYYDPNAQAA